MGLPFVVLNMVSVLMFKRMDISDAQIAFWTSLIMLPWTLKPLWSPFLGMFKTKKFFVVLTQIVTAVAFGLVALSLKMPHFFSVAVALLFLIAFSGATHDVATDGVYMTELSKSDQARYIGWQGAFYNMAKIFAAGGLVYLAGYLIGRVGNVHAWMAVMGICGAIMLLLGAYHVRALPSGGAAAGRVSTFADCLQSLWTVLRAFFTKKNIAWYIGFIILYRFAEGFVMKIVPLFLKSPVEQQGLGLSEEQIGLYYGTFGAVAFVLGSVLSGYYVAARGLKNALLPLCCTFNLPFVAYLLLAVYQPSSGWLIAPAIIVEYFGYGFGFVGLTLFMMQQVASGEFQMAHYAFASGIMNLGVMLPGMLSGVVSDWLGYKYFFVFVLAATIPAFLITWLVRKLIANHQ
jgi:PAT family beta-lactamase induction signal transducer AmpG